MLNIGDIVSVTIDGAVWDAQVMAVGCTYVVLAFIDAGGQLVQKGKEWYVFDAKEVRIRERKPQ